MTDTVTTRRTGGWGRAANLLWRLLRIEARGYQSMFRLVFRRPRVPRGAVGFGYHRNVLMVLIVFVVVSVVELVVVDLIVRQWGAYVRIPLLVLGIWGVVYMFGMLCGMLTRPHAIGPKGLRVRDGTEVDVDLPWEVVRAVEQRTVTIQDKTPKVTLDNGVRTFHVRVQKETNIEVELERSLRLRLPHGVEWVDRVAFYVDDPGDYMRHMLAYA